MCVVQGKLQCSSPTAVEAYEKIQKEKKDLALGSRVNAVE